MRYSLEPRDRIYVKGYRFLSFATNIGTHPTKVAKNMSNKYSKMLLDSAKKSTIDTIKNASKRAIQKTEEATGDLIGNKMTNKITSISKSLKQLHSKTDENETETPKEGYISLEEDNKIFLN